MSDLDPPTPIPAHLWPQPGPLYDDDLCLVLTPGELAEIARTVAAVPHATMTRTIHRDGSPWIEFSVVTGPHPATRLADADPDLYGVERFALWRYTLAVHRVGTDGAVEDEPISRPEGPHGLDLERG